MMPAAGAVEPTEGKVHPYMYVSDQPMAMSILCPVHTKPLLRRNASNLGDYHHFAMPKEGIRIGLMSKLQIGHTW